MVFGVLTVNTEQQAVDRATGPDNHGISWAKVTVCDYCRFTVRHGLSPGLRSVCGYFRVTVRLGLSAGLRSVCDYCRVTVRLGLPPNGTTLG